MKYLSLLLAAIAFPLSAQEFFTSVSGDKSNSQKLLFSQARHYEEGFVLSSDNEITIDNIGKPTRNAGASWTVTLNQKVPMPFSATAQSILDDSTGLNNDGYSLYLDIIYMDNTPLWGQRVLFPPTTGEWQARTVTVIPDKPVKTVTVHLLFCNTAGKARFREPILSAVNNTDACLFDTIPVTIKNIPTEPMFLARDVEKDGNFVALSSMNASFRSVLKTKQMSMGATFYDLSLESLERSDRMLTVIYAIPVPEGNVMWHDTPRDSTVKPQTQCSSTIGCDVGCGAYSRWPFGAISVGGNFSAFPFSHEGARGMAIGRDPDTFAIYRIGYNPDTRLLYIAFDLGFTPERPDANVRFCVFDFKSQDMFRGALAAYQKLFTEAHKRRLAKHGVWMPFYAISAVEGYEDFGFKFKEGDDEPAWDDQHDIITFHYTEPTTWWMPMKGDTYSFEDCLKEAERLAANGDPYARAWKTSAYKNEYGNYAGRLLDEPWCKGIVWNLNSAPNITGEINDYKAKNSVEDFKERYASEVQKGIDGEYVDSSELYVTDSMDFDRNHFTGMDTPLCFSLHTHKVGIYSGAIVFEYVRDLARRLHPINRFTMANCTPSRWCWLAPHLDLLGTETDWNSNNRWTPMTHDDLMYRRVICGDKPYCFLQNTNFENFTYEHSEKFMMRSLAYGFFPGYFSANAATNHYFTNPNLYNRDRPLFKKYIPFCRLVSEAGWHPVNNLADSTSPGIFVEQFGDHYLTVFNDTDKPQTATLRAKGTVTACRELIEKTRCEWQNDTCTIQIPPESVRLLEITIK